MYFRILGAGFVRPPDRRSASPEILIRHSRILLATDGSAGSRGAALLARLLVDRQSGELVVATVAEAPLAQRTGGPLPLPTPAEERARIDEHLRAVRRQLRGAGLASTAAPIRVGLEAPARFITAEAERQEADLVVLGMGRRGLRRRVFADEVPTDVVRLSTVPVLVVPARSRKLPVSAVVGFDFSPFAEAAARQAAFLVGPGGQVHLVHAIWSGVPEEERKGAMDTLRHAAEELADQFGVTPGTHIVEPPAATALIDLARELRADLIGVGSHGRGFVDRLLAGSTTTKLVRAASTCVLAIPAERGGRSRMPD
jgi:nucleotide-binding universal stress UspA family protein